MIKLTVRDIINRAKQIADLENSDFISWNENSYLLNEAFHSLYQDTINNNDKYNISILDKEFYKKDDYNGNGDAYDLPEDFYQLLSITDKITGTAIIRKAATEPQLSLNTYDIENNILTVYSNYDYEIKYYKNPVTLYLKNEDVEIENEAIDNILSGEQSLYELIKNKRLIVTANDRYFLLLLRKESTDPLSNIIGITTAYIVNRQDNIIDEIDMTDHDGYWKDDEQITINSISIGTDEAVFQSYQRVIIYDITDKAEHIQELTQTVYKADYVEKAEVVNNAELVKHADVVQTAITSMVVADVVEQANIVKQATTVENADTVTNTKNTIINAGVVENADIVNNATTVRDTRTVVTSGTVMNAGNVNTSQNVSKADRIGQVSSVVNATTVDNAGTVNNVNAINKAEKVETVTNANNVENASVLDSANYINSVNSVGTVNNATNVINAQNVTNAKEVIIAENVATVTRVDTVDNVTTVNNADNVTNVNTVNTIQNVNTVQHANNVENADNATNVNSVNTIQNVSNVQHTDSVTTANTVNNATSVNTVNTIQNVERADTVGQVNTIQTVQNATTVNQANTVNNATTVGNANTVNKVDTLVNAPEASTTSLGLIKLPTDSHKGITVDSNGVASVVKDYIVREDTSTGMYYIQFESGLLIQWGTPQAQSGSISDYANLPKKYDGFAFVCNTPTPGQTITPTASDYWQYEGGLIGRLERPRGSGVGNRCSMNVCVIGWAKQ